MSIEGVNVYAANLPDRDVCGERGKKCSSVVAVALLAIGTLIIGILAIVATLPNCPGALQILHHIGLPGAITLTVLGIVFVPICVALYYWQFCSSKRQEASLETDPASTVNNPSSTAAPPSVPIQTPTEPLRTDVSPPTTSSPPESIPRPPPETKDTATFPQHASAPLPEIPTLTTTSSPPESIPQPKKVENKPEIKVTLYAPQQVQRTPSVHLIYVDPFSEVQTQEQFEKKLTELLKKIPPHGPCDDKTVASELALLSTAIELCKYVVPPQAIQQIAIVLQNSGLSLGIAFPLKLLSCKNQTAVDGQMLQKGVRLQSRETMSLCFERGLTTEKSLAITASVTVEGNDFGTHGLRMAVHQRPGPRTTALIRAHINEFLSGKRNFIFPSPNPKKKI